MGRSITWPVLSPDLTPRIIHVCRTYGALLSIPLSSALKRTVTTMNTCCNYESPMLVS